MPTKKSSQKDKDELLGQNSSGNTSHQLNVYYVRLHDAKDKLQLEMHFDDGIKLEFSEEIRLCNSESCSPFIYVLPLRVKMDNGKLSVNHKGHMQEIGNYYLQISHTVNLAILIGTLLTHNEESSQQHSLDDYFEKKHLFLFNIRFSKKFSQHVPGVDTNVFTNVCLFTYYLLRDKEYHLFDVLVEQFPNALPPDDNISKRSVFQDFFDKCNRYLPAILTTSDDKFTILKIILRMIGLISIRKGDFDSRDQNSYQFAQRIMFDVRKECRSLLQSVNEMELVLFKSGLITLLCIDILYTGPNKSNTNNVTFLQEIPDEHQRQHIANELLYQLNILEQPIFGDSNWTDLFTIVDPAKININHLNLTNSCQMFVICIRKIATVIPNPKEFSEGIAGYFNDRVYRDLIQVDLESIIFLIDFLEMEIPDRDEAVKHLLYVARSAITESAALRNKIQMVFAGSTVTTDNMNKISTVLGLCSMDKFKMLRYISKDKLLDKSLTGGSSIEYYIKWFQYFLAKSKIWIGSDRELRKQLFQKWADNAMHENNHKHIEDVLSATDRLLGGFDQLMDDDWFRMHFIDYIIQLCFKQGSIIRVIEDSLLNIKNDHFRAKFQNRFHQWYINRDQNSSQTKKEEESPLYQLIKLDRMKQNKSMIVSDLIQMICQKIEVTMDKLLDDTFRQPTNKTYTYIVLFEEEFQKLPVRQKVIEQLKPILEKWEKDGFQSDEMQTWDKKLNKQQRAIVCKIWNLIGESAKKLISFETLINKTSNTIKAIEALIQNIRTCVDNYCQEASETDKQYYDTQFKKIREQLKTNRALAIRVPENMKKVNRLARRLNRVSLSSIWKDYFKRNLKSKELQGNSVNDGQGMTCLKTLEQATKILDDFQTHLINLCTDIKQPLFPQLNQLFPETYSKDNELGVLRLLPVDDNTVSRLEIFLEYWKNREHINCIYKACQNLSIQYNISNSDKLSLLQNIFELNDQTSCETCIAIYNEYRTHYLNKYSETTRKLIVQLDSSKELVQFISSLEKNNVNDLLEVVNDWDESLINTKTVFDFVLLKRFFDKVDTKIKPIRSDMSLELGDIMACFQTVLAEDEFENILDNIRFCSKNLNSIRRIGVNMANQEQSKRRAILDIMSHSHFSFSVHQLKETVKTGEYACDVHGIGDKSKPISFDGLYDLRDRARLIQYGSSSSANVQHYTDYEIQQLQLFVSLVDTIEIVLQSLTSLYIAGYPVEKKYPMSERQFPCKEGHYQELTDFKLELKKQLADWEKCLCNYYQKCVSLTYFTYQQISIVENCLHQQATIMSDDSTYHLLKFIGIDLQSIQPELLLEKSEDPVDILKTMAAVMKTKSDQPRFPLEENDESKEKIFFIETTNKGILRAIYSLFSLNNMRIAASQLFYCTENTNWIEIRAFIYRCFYSETLHQLIRPELLSIVIQDHFTQLLNQLTEQQPTHLFRLGIITTTYSAHLHLVNGLKTYRTIRIVRNEDLLSETVLRDTIRTHINNKCTLVTSKIAGIGKSTYIQNEIRRLEKNLIKFPVSGNVDIDTLMERLRDKKIQFAPSTTAIHIDIGPVSNVQQLNEFLYCLVLFRCFRLGQMPIDVPNDIPIYIELDSSSYLSNLKEEFVIFQYLEHEYIDRMALNELEHRSAAVQLVANYLQAIKYRTIDKKDITEDTITTIDQSTCISLLQTHFLLKKNPEFISWTRLSISISVYYKLFSGFSKCGYFIVDSVDSESPLRFDILDTLLKSSDQFTSLSVETVRRNQRSIYNNESSSSLSEAIVRWDKTQPFILIFTATNEPFFVYKARKDILPSLERAFLSHYQLLNKERIVKTTSQRKFSFFQNLFTTTNNTQVPSSIKTPEQALEEFLIDPNKMTHEQFFLRLTSLSTKHCGQKSICERCFSQNEYNQKQCTYCRTQGSLIQPKSIEHKDIQDFQKLIAEKLHSEYVLTPDNYVKMLLIYLRVQSNLPVLIMGETGCGKTALIQCLCEKILGDDMAVFRIHAGVSNEQIIETVGQFIVRAEKDKDKRLWVFFDEFNTTPNIGLLKEIICDRTLLGQPLPTNMVFLGACNPQRLSVNKEELTDGIGITKYRLEIQHQINSGSSTFLYSVVPIPETMLEHVWDYGHLDKITEKTYIETILNVCKQLKTNRVWFDFIVDAISKSQEFFREREDVSSVSLRDVDRFCRFYKWFVKFPVPDKNESTNVLKSINQIQRASLIALLLCYYFRLSSKEKREDYMNIIVAASQESKQQISLSSLNILLENEKMALIQRMESPPGTALNRALTDNIFVLFTCIFNQIPVILCGKPGSSKTSAVQIIITNLKEKLSEDPFFKSLKKLIAISYQGSHNCTSESIIKVFAQADKCAQADKNEQDEQADKGRREKKDEDILPVIVFDEIGLAELSPHNPLKVLHNELEIGKCRHSFVGLSNWRLDASKMNRAIYLSCPDPDLNDLEITALKLSESILSGNTQTVSLEKPIIKGLAVAYMEMCKYMEKKKYQHYFGLRDYYSLIKGIEYDRIQEKNKERDLYDIIRHHLSFNFDAIFDGSKFMWEKFCEHMQQLYKITEYISPTFGHIIDQNLSSRTGRFLMLVGECENDFDYIQRYITIKQPSVQTHTLIGSIFAGDFLSSKTYTEQYNTRIIMDIILYAEKDITLFLRGLGHLYDNLYDLFNQNFAVSGRKKFCRIALGSVYHPRCVVHENFYCVVFVKQQDLDRYDPPFLNRFEKHLINIGALIDERQKTVMSKLKEWIDDILLMKPNENFLCPKQLFIEYSDNYIFNLVTDVFDHSKISENDIDEQDVLRCCQEQILRVSSFDLPLFLSIDPSNDHTYLIQQYYEIHTELSFSSFITQQLKQEKIPKLLIYTYTQIHHDIDYKDINKDQTWVSEVKLSHFKTELELIQKIKSHQQAGTARSLLIRVDCHQEYKHVPMLKHILFNKQIVDETLGICLIFHLQRNRLNEINNDVFFNGWSRVMIDNLQKHQVIPLDILQNPSYAELIVHLNFLNVDMTFNELINRCLMQLHYTVTDRRREADINKRRERIIRLLTDKTNHGHGSLRSHIKSYLQEMMQNICHGSSETQFQDWRQDLLTTEIIIGSCRSLNDAIIKTVSFFVEKCLSVLFVHLEKHSMIDSYLFFTEPNIGIASGYKSHPLWSDCWTTTTDNIDMSIMTQNYMEIPLIFDLHLPFPVDEYKIIEQIRLAHQTITQDNQNINENWINSAYIQLTNKSIYRQFINKILADEDLFHHYFHDQLTLARNEADTHQISTSFIQRLLTSKIPGTVMDQLSHLLVDHKELFEIMRVFEIGIPFIGHEDKVFDILYQQFLNDNDTQEKIIPNRNQLYRLIKKSEFHLLRPELTVADETIFDCNGNPFIELSLMNLLELLISPNTIDCISDMKQFMTEYGRIIQSMNKIFYYNHYSVFNFEKFNAFIRLASCVSTLYPNDKALKMLKQISKYNDFRLGFNKPKEINEFINYLKKVIREQQSTANETIVHQTLLKFENELLRNWSIDNSDQCSYILKIINEHDQDLWKYAAKTFTIIDKSLQLSSAIMQTNEEILKDVQYGQINEYLRQIKDSTHKIEILLCMRIYMKLVLDENCQTHINENNIQQLPITLISEFENFKKNLDQIQLLQDDRKLECICLIAWCRYYLLYYMYALKRDIKDNIMERMDTLLLRDTSTFCSTVKLYIIKQLCRSENITFHDLRSLYTKRNIAWIHSILNQPTNQQALNAQRDVILPTPLFECRDEFQQVNSKLTPYISCDDLRNLIGECSLRQDTAYCFLLWFIHYYTHFYVNNLPPSNPFVELISQGVKDDLIRSFDSIGYKLILFLCTNFDEKSYFRLDPLMIEEDFHQRLLVLNIIALILSFKSFKKSTFLSCLLLDRELKEPSNYAEHLTIFDSLTGVAPANNPALRQMINIQTYINEKVKSKMSIFRCSSDCFWLFCFVNCNIPGEQKQCPLCEKQINVTDKDNYLIVVEPHILMTSDEALQFITQYIQQHKTKDNVNIIEKPKHLHLSVTYRFLSFFTHAILLFLNELHYLTTSNSGIDACFREYIKTNYILLRKHLSNGDQCYIWLYKIINHMMHKDFLVTGHLDTPEEVIKLEKLIEDKLILPHIDSVVGEIQSYKSLYADFVYGADKQNTLVNFVDELVENNKKYPLLNFFNVTNIHSIDIIDDFHIKLKLLTDRGKTYPLTTFCLKHLSDYENIQYLYPIIEFINYLIKRFEYRINRNDAKRKTIAECIEEDSNSKKIYETFLNVWYRITLKKVVFNNNEYNFQHTYQQHLFKDKTKILMFLLHTSNENENIIPTACIQTLANLQNDIVDYFHSHVVNYKDKDEEYTHRRIIPLQSIQQKHLFDFSRNKLRKLLIERGLMINYAYGMSKEMIHNYEEIEWNLRTEVNSLLYIDTENIRYFNYQYELYDETKSLINIVRERFKQKLLDERKRKEIQKFINVEAKDSISEIRDSLEDILKYLSSITEKNIIKTSTIRTFIDANRELKACVNNKLEQEPFSSIDLQYIIDLYELIEEYYFDQILSNNIRNELCEKSFEDNEQKSIINQFINMILHNQNLANCLKDIDCWISMFKRLLARVLSPKVNINFDSSLQDCIKRTDMWKENVTQENIQTIEIASDTRLKHAFIILKGMEAEKSINTSNENDVGFPNPDYTQENSRNTTSTTGSRSQSRNTSSRANPSLSRNFLRT